MLKRKPVEPFFNPILAEAVASALEAAGYPESAEVFDKGFAIFNNGLFAVLVHPMNLASYAECEAEVREYIGALKAQGFRTNYVPHLQPERPGATPCVVVSFAGVDPNLDPQLPENLDLVNSGPTRWQVIGPGSMPGALSVHLFKTDEGLLKSYLWSYPGQAAHDEIKKFVYQNPAPGRSQFIGERWWVIRVRPD